MRKTGLFKLRRTKLWQWTAKTLLRSGISCFNLNGEVVVSSVDCPGCIKVIVLYFEFGIFDIFPTYSEENPNVFGPQLLDCAGQNAIPIMDAHRFFPVHDVQVVSKNHRF